MEEIGLNHSGLRRPLQDTRGLYRLAQLSFSVPEGTDSDKSDRHPAQAINVAVQERFHARAAPRHQAGQ